MPNRPRRLVRRFFTSCAAALAACVLACGCGGGGGSSQPAFAAPAPTPSPSPTPPPAGPLAASQSTATFSLAGQSAPVTVNEPGYTGIVSADASACASVASVAPASANAPATFSVTALGSGSCAIAFVDVYGQRATVQIGVTVTQGTIK
jgi:hypothetical protein